MPANDGFLELPDLYRRVRVDVVQYALTASKQEDVFEKRVAKSVEAVARDRMDGGMEQQRTTTRSLNRGNLPVTRHFGSIGSHPQEEVPHRPWVDLDSSAQTRIRPPLLSQPGHCDALNLADTLHPHRHPLPLQDDGDSLPGDPKLSTQLVDGLALPIARDE